MPFRQAIKDREHDKFVESPTGETSVRVLVSNETGAEIPISGTISASYSAPTGPIKNTVFTVTDSAQNPLPTPQTNRVSVSIRNKSLTETVYVGGLNTVTADDSATGGWEVGPQEDFNLDLDDSNVFFLITTTGNTAQVKILEIASSTSGGGGGMSGTMIQEQLSGTVDGVNVTFTTTYNPVSDAQFILFVNGVYQRITTHYTRAGLVVTMVTAPAVGQQVEAIYWY